MADQIYDVVIIGCGPAGLSAAIYAARAQLKTLILGDYKKSNLYKSHIIANYFGFPTSLTGPELTLLGIDHAKLFGTEHVFNEVVDIKINDGAAFTISDEKKQKYSAKTIIIATGQSYALSGIKNEKELTGKGVSYCVVCDGFFFKDKNVVVIGAGNYAGEEALQLLAYTKKVTILSHGKDFNFSPEIKEALDKEDIKYEKTVRIKEVNGNGKSEKIILSDGKEIPAEGVFMAVGAAGATAFAKMLGLQMNGNYIKADLDGRTNIPGIFAAGDCTGSPPQVATSVGNGCNAALSAIKLLRGLKVYIQYD